MTSGSNCYKEGNSKMKRNKVLIRPIIFFLIFGALFIVVSRVVSVNDSPSQMNIKGFFQEPKDSLDVAMIGPSELYADYAAPLAWEKYRYTSYSLSMGAAPGSVYQPMLEAVLRRQKPKLVVFSLNGFIQGSDKYQDPIELHRWIDNVPWSENKFETIQKTIPFDKRDQYYFDIIFSHVNWKMPTTVIKNAAEKLCMIKSGQAYTKGICSVSKKDNGSAVGQLEAIRFDRGCENTLKSLLQTCRDNSIEHVLFVRFPHQRAFSNPEEMDRIASVIQKYDYDLLNLNDKAQELGISYNDDFSDPEHMNVNGMKKMTDYLGQYIISHYDVITAKTDAEEERWDNCAKRTESLIQEIQKDIDNGIARFYYEASIYWKPIQIQ